MNESRPGRSIYERFYERSTLSRKLLITFDKMTKENFGRTDKVLITLIFASPLVHRDFLVRNLIKTCSCGFRDSGIQSDAIDAIESILSEMVFLFI